MVNIDELAESVLVQLGASESELPLPDLLLMWPTALERAVDMIFLNPKYAPLRDNFRRAVAVTFDNGTANLGDSVLRRDLLRYAHIQVGDLPFPAQWVNGLLELNMQRTDIFAYFTTEGEKLHLKSGDAPVAGEITVTGPATPTGEEASNNPALLDIAVDEWKKLGRDALLLKRQQDGLNNPRKGQ